MLPRAGGDTQTGEGNVLTRAGLMNREFGIAEELTVEVIVIVFIGSLAVGAALALVGLVVVLVKSLVWQRQGLSTQQQAMSHVEESLELSRRAVQLQERANALAEEMLKNQLATLETLRQLGGGAATETGIRA
jgi:hypothetical protein